MKYSNRLVFLGLADAQWSAAPHNSTDQVQGHVPMASWTPRRRERPATLRPPKRWSSTTWDIGGNSRRPGPTSSDAAVCGRPGARSKKPKPPAARQMN